MRVTRLATSIGGARSNRAHIWGWCVKREIDPDLDFGIVQGETNTTAHGGYSSGLIHLAHLPPFSPVLGNLSPPKRLSDLPASSGFAKQ